MTLATGLGPSSGFLRLALILAAMGLAAGCQTGKRAEQQQPHVVASPDGDWQVVERLGEGRYRTTSGGWSPTMPAIRLPEGSRVATGGGGRLILARSGEHITAGPASRFSLPDGMSGAPLEHRVGWLRYRIDGTAARELQVTTPFLEIEAAAAVFDVTVDATATEIAVQDGQVRVTAPDGLRQIELTAGQSAYAGGGSEQSLAFRRAAGAPAEPVEATVLPAMQPRAEVREGRATTPIWAAAYAGSRASTSGAAASSAAVPIALAEAKAIPAVQAAAPEFAPTVPTPEGVAPRDPSALDTPVDGAAQDAHDLSTAPAAARVDGVETADRAASPPRPASAFDRLSEGMVHGVPSTGRGRQPASNAQRPL